MSFGSRSMLFYETPMDSWRLDFDLTILAWAILEATESTDL